MTPVPFKIAITDRMITRLRQKLALADFPNEVVDAENVWSRGAPLTSVKSLVSYWEKEFDWRKAEAKLNEFKQYITPIEVTGFDTYAVHFIHQPSSAENAIPLLFIHGWPGSFVEVTKILPDLVKEEGNAPVFHIVAPSLINFGFSDGCKKPGFNIDQHAEACHKLMLSLGYDSYVIQGGDLGHLVARFMASKYGVKHVKAYHINSAVPAAPTAKSHPDLYGKQLTASDLAGLDRAAMFGKEGDSYYKQQSTKPQTIGYSLADSPVGLLAWIYEKLHDWGDDYAWTDDEILTWVSIYYFSKAGPSASSEICYEMEHRDPPAFAAAQVYIDVPLGIARFPNDLVLLPKLWNQTLGPVVFESEHDRGGHFAAWECPEAIIGDLRTMFGKNGPAYEVTGKPKHENA